MAGEGDEQEGDDQMDGIWAGIKKNEKRANVKLFSHKL